MPDWGRFGALLGKYGLAICCVVAPLLLGYWAPNEVAGQLFPKLTGKANVFEYVFATEPLPKAEQPSQGEKPKPTGKEDSKAQPAPKSAPSSAADAKGKLTPKVEQGAAIANSLAGRYAYIAMSSFLYAVSFAAMLFAGVVVVRRLGWTVFVTGIVVFVLIGVWVAFKATGYEYGRFLLLDHVLAEADKRAVFKPLIDAQTGTFATARAISDLVVLNTFVALVPVGMVLIAFGALAVRDNRELTFADQAQQKTAREEMLKDLRARMFAIRGMLAIASAILVIAVLASKALMDWPLKLLHDEQAKIFKPLAEAITTHLGVSGTIALFAAVVPALTAWSFDVSRYRTAVADGAPPAQTPADGLDFAPIPAIGNIVVILAPVLAAPIAELLKGLTKFF